MDKLSMNNGMNYSRQNEQNINGDGQVYFLPSVTGLQGCVQTCWALTEAGVA